MPEKNNLSLDRTGDGSPTFIRGLYKDLRLIFRLLKDHRVNPFLKLLPIGSLVYLVVPLDIFPINPIDDALVVWLGSYLFIELCPDDIVEEHRKALNRAQFDEKDDNNLQRDIVDAEFTEVQDED